MTVTRPLVASLVAVLLVGGAPAAAEGGTPGEVRLVAGTGETGYSGDGWQADRARLNTLLGVSVGPDGAVFIADTLNKRLRRVGTDGVIDTVEGTRARRSPETDGPEHRGLTYSPSNAPTASAVAQDGTLYVAGNDDIRRITPDGKSAVIAGAGEKSFLNGDGGDGGPATEAWLHEPGDIALGPDGSVYVADTTQGRVRRIDRGGVITTVAGGGQARPANGAKATAVRLVDPSRIAVDAGGVVYVTVERGPAVYRIAPDGAFSVLIDLKAASAVGGVAVDGEGTVLITDRRDGRVYRVGGDGAAEPASPRLPGAEDLAVGPDGDLYVAGRGQVYRVVTGGAAGPGPRVDPAPSRWADDEPGTVHEVLAAADAPTAVQTGPPGPESVAVGPDGTVYVAEPRAHRVRKISPDGTVAAFAGTGEAGSDGDGRPAEQARLTEPRSVAVTASGEVYIADGGAGKVRRVDADGVMATVATVAGVRGVAVGPDGGLVATTEEGVFAVTARGALTRVAGGGGRWADKADGHPAAQASLWEPGPVAVAEDGAVHLIEAGRPAVRTVRSDRTLVTTAGDSYYSRNEGGFAGDGGPATRAELNTPTDVAVAPDGALVIADTHNNRVRRVGPDGVITTVAGTGERADSGDGGPAAKAALTEPTAVAVDADGALYVTGRTTTAVRKIARDGTITTLADLAEPAAPRSEAVSDPRSFAVGPDGALSIADPRAGVVRITPDGTPEEVDTGLALSWGPVHALAHGPDGALYLGSGELVRRAPDGTSAVVLSPATPDGKGLPRFADLDVGPDGVPYLRTGHSVRALRDGALVTVLSGLSSDTGGIAVGPDGAVYAVDGEFVVAAGPDGKPVPVAGSDNPVPDEEADGGPALAARFENSVDVAVTADGTLFVSGFQGIRRIDRDGVVDTVVPPVTEGHGTYAYGTIAVGPGGDLYFADLHHKRINVVVRPAELPGAGGFPWTAVLLAAAGLVLVAGLAVLLPRRRARDDAADPAVAEDGTGRAE